MARGIEQLDDADPHPRLNPLGNRVDPALDGVEVIQQVYGFAVEVEPRFGQLDAAGIAYKQHHIEAGLHTFNGVADGRGGDSQLGRGFAKAAKSRRGGEGQQVLFGKDGIHIMAPGTHQF